MAKLIKDKGTHGGLSTAGIQIFSSSLSFLVLFFSVLPQFLSCAAAAGVDAESHPAHLLLLGKGQEVSWRKPHLKTSQRSGTFKVQRLKD